MLMQKEVVDVKHFRRFILFSRIEFVEDCFYTVCIVRECFVLNNWVRLHSVINFSVNNSFEGNLVISRFFSPELK